MSRPSLPALPHAEHLARVRDLAALGADEALYVVDLTNIRYLTGFTGSAATVVVLRDAALLLTDERYVEQAATQAGGIVAVHAAAASEQLRTLAGLVTGVRTLLFDPDQVTVAQHDRLAVALAPVTLTARSGVVELARRIKNAAELARIRAAASIAVDAYADVRTGLDDEPTEEEVAYRFAEAVRGHGGDGLAFPTIVATGERTSMPHAVPGDRRVRAGELLLMDFGATVDGYRSDVTRTAVLGAADEEATRLLAVVQEAHDRGIAAARPGVTHADLDATCRRVLTDNGYAGGPTHPFGHHLGLAIHERPYLTADAAEPLEPGHVLTVEPGVYLPGTRGCRIEDTILITGDGAEVLSRSTTLH